VGEEFEIESGSTHHDGEPSPARNFVDDGGGEGEVAGGIVGSGGIRDAVEVVGGQSLLLRGRCGGDDFEAAVELEGVGIDNLSIEGFGQGQGDAGFARGRGTAEEKWGKFQGDGVIIGGNGVSEKKNVLSGRAREDVERKKAVKLGCGLFVVSAGAVVGFRTWL